MSGLKIVVIGGGSSYTPELIEGLLKRHAEMPVKSLWLVDIEFIMYIKTGGSPPGRMLY